LLEKTGASALLARRRSAYVGSDEHYPREGAVGVNADLSYGWGLGDATLRTVVPFSGPPSQ
jgi:hypothetical protein